MDTKHVIVCYLCYFNNICAAQVPGQQDTKWPLLQLPSVYENFVRKQIMVEIDLELLYCYTILEKMTFQS